jgi:hypothetical protein
MEQLITIDQCNGMWQVKYEGVVYYEMKTERAAIIMASSMENQLEVLDIISAKANQLVKKINAQISKSKKISYVLPSKMNDL